MATKELLGTNRGFELGNTSQFTFSGATSNLADTTIERSGTYGLQNRIVTPALTYPHAAGTTNIYIYSAAVYCAPGLAVTASFWHKTSYYVKDAGAWYGGDGWDALVRWYDSGMSSLSTSSIGSDTTFWDNTTYEEATNTFTAPANTVYCRIEVHYEITAGVTSGENQKIEWKTACDDFSITVPGAVARPMIIS